MIRLNNDAAILLNLYVQENHIFYGVIRMSLSKDERKFSLKVLDVNYGFISILHIHDVNLRENPNTKGLQEEPFYSYA